MRNRVVVLAVVSLLVSLVVSGCVVTVQHSRAVPAPGVARPTASTAPPTTTTVPPTTTTTPISPTTAGEAAAKAVSDGRVAVDVYDRATGTTLASHDTGETFETESVVKILIALATLESGDAQAAQVKEMLARSDDLTADALWSEHGSGAIVTQWAKTIGLHSTHRPADDRRWGDTPTTAADLVRVYLYLLDDAPATTRSIILSGMTAATHYGQDGTNQYFGIPDAAPRPWAVKQGWGCCKPNRVLHTTGVLGPDDRYIVIVLTSHDASTSWEHDDAEITAAVTALLPALPT